MKLRHLLFGLLAGVAFVACTNDNEPAGVTPVKGGDEVAVTRSYMKVDFVMPGATTRAGETFEAGTEDENKINNGVLFFFDDSKLQVAAPFDLGADNENWTTQTPNEDNKYVEKESPVIVVLENPLKTPTAVLAVLNLGDKATLESAGIDGTKSLDELKAIVANYATEKQSKGKFVMSSSAYKGAKFDVAAEITEAQIYPTYDEAASAKEPVIIPVERVLAKVNVKAQESYDTGSTFKRTKEVDGKEVTETVKIMAKITGFWIDNVAPESLLLKDISANKDGEVADGGDNDASNKRSYWAKSNYGGKNLQHFAYTPTTADKYVQENTGTDPTKVVVGATLTDEQGTPLPLVKFKGKLYTKAAFEVDVHGILAAKYFHKGTEDGKEVYSSITDKEVGFTYEKVANVQYKAQATLAYTGDKDNLYKKVGTTYTKVTGDTVDFDADDKAGFTIQLWDNGKTYYYVDIKHDATRKGVVRNHVYKLTVTSVTGLGTPVPFSESQEVIIPTKPEPEEETYISAKIQVLAWKIVEQSDIVLGQ